MKEGRGAINFKSNQKKIIEKERINDKVKWKKERDREIVKEE